MSGGGDAWRSVRAGLPWPPGSRLLPVGWPRILNYRSEHLLTAASYGDSILLLFRSFSYEGP